MCNTIIVIINRLIKVAKFRLIEKAIIVKKLAYKVNNALFIEYSLLEEFIID